MTDDSLGWIDVSLTTSVTNFRGKTSKNPPKDVFDCLIHPADHGTAVQVPAQEIGVQKDLFAEQTSNKHFLRAREVVVVGPPQRF